MHRQKNTERPLEHGCKSFAKLGGAPAACGPVWVQDASRSPCRSSNKTLQPCFPSLWHGPSRGSGAHIGSQSFWQRDGAKVCAQPSFKVLYQVQADAMEEALKEVKVLVGTTAFMRKFLGGSSEWCRSFQNRRVDTLLIDEVHQDAFLRLPGLIARAPRAVLFGDSRHEFAPITQHSSANQLEAETSFDWVGRAGMPAFQLNGTFRVGENICRVLRVTGDHPDAVSEAAAPATVFFASSL